MSCTFFGEVMLRLTPSQPKQLLLAANELAVNFAGAESNVASGLARLGHCCSFVSKFPNNLLGDKAINSLASYGIDTKHCLRGGERIGTYYIELGESIRPSKVLYDRANSAFSQLSANEIDWQHILKGSNWLFLGGITLALSEQCVEESINAAKTAQAMGVKVAFDLNFRRSLWQRPDLATKYFSKMLENSDLALGNLGVVQDVFGDQFEHFLQSNSQATAIEESSHELHNIATSNLQPRNLSRQNLSHQAALFLQNRYSIDVAFTERLHKSASKNGVSGFYLNQRSNELTTTPSIDVEIVDRLGTGDAFAAGILHGLNKGFTPQQLVDFANASFALAHTQLGDQNLVCEDDILAVASGQLSGHVIR